MSPRPVPHRDPLRRGAAAAFAVLLVALSAWTGVARAQNPIVTENARTGSPASEWDVSGSGDPPPSRTR